MASQSAEVVLLGLFEDVDTTFQRGVESQGRRPDRAIAVADENLAQPPVEVVCQTRPEEPTQCWQW